MRTRSMIVLVSLAAGLGAGVADASVIENFDNGFSGWTVYGDVNNFVHLVAGGNPGSCLQAHDLNDGILWGFNAGPRFLGNHRCAYGGTISWTHKTTHFSTATGSTSAEIEIEGAGMVLVYDIPGTFAAGTWVNRTVTLLETAGWRKTSISGVVPTQAEFQAVLSNIEEMRFRAEFSNTADTGQIDTVVLDTTNGTCCPADLANGSGQGIPDTGVDINDLLYFLGAFEAGAPSADLTDGNGTFNPDGGVDINDLLFFLAHFEAGC